MTFTHAHVLTWWEVGVKQFYHFLFHLISITFITGSCPTSLKYNILICWILWVHVMSPSIPRKKREKKKRNHPHIFGLLCCTETKPSSQTYLSDAWIPEWDSTQRYWSSNKHLWRYPVLQGLWGHGFSYLDPTIMNVAVVFSFEKPLHPSWM